jgi:glycine/D-amino acid oxidase-like deaminating enzyme
MDVPVNPMRRFEHFVEIADAAAADAAHQGSRPPGDPPEGTGYSVGLVESGRAARIQLRRRPAGSRRVWPACAERIPAFEALKLRREWAGLYDECELDGNMILGNWPAGSTTSTSPADSPATA